jgi:hypothetical protein
MKDWPKEWKVPVIPNKVPISKKKAEDGTSNQSTSPIANIRKATECAKEMKVVQPSRSQGRKLISQRLQLRK